MKGNQLFRLRCLFVCLLFAGTAPAYCQQRYDDDAKTWYSISANSTVLEVHLKIADSIQQAKIVGNGLELWVDVRGKKNKTTGILYPIAAARPAPKKGAGAAAPDVPQQEGGNRVREKLSLQPLIDRQREMKLVGFGDDLNGLQNQHHPSGIDVTLRLANDTLYYDARIPMNLIAGVQGANSRISVGIIEKGKDPSEFMGDMPGGPPPGGDGMGPGGPPPPGGGGAPPDMGNIEQLFAINTIWYKITVLK